MIIDPYTWHRLAIEKRDSIASETIAIRLTRPVGYSFRAGQYAVVRVTKPSGEQFIRQYSLSSAPSDDELEFLIQREPAGEVTGWFHDDAHVGDFIEVSQPFGNFTIEKWPKRPVLLIAGRIGIAPYISMVREARPNAAISIMYSVRNKAQICFPDILNKFPTTVIETDTSPRLSPKELQPHLAAHPIVYLCGSKQFVDSMSMLLKSLDVIAPDLRRELFTLQ